MPPPPPEHQDSSTRLVLPDDAAYVANLAALWAADATLAATIEALDEHVNYAVEPSKSGSHTVCLPTPDGKSIYLHSRYRPVEEAQKLIDAVPVDDRAMFHVCGFGLGYHVEALFDRAGDEAILCVL
jgi:hypothetical protein